jgi:hypothetical protein
MKTKIPPATIGLLSTKLPDYYTHDQLNSLFLTASAPENIPEGSKSNKVTNWLRSINNQCDNPLEVLGSLLSDLMEKESDHLDLDTIAQLEDDRKKILECLAKCLVPESYGVTYREIKEVNLWSVYCMLMPRQRLKCEKKYATLKRASLR